MNIYIIGCLCTSVVTVLIGSELTIQEKQMAQYMAVPRPYKLNTPSAIISYLPDRLNALVSYFNQNGFDATRTWIEHDPDLDSSLFILETQEPYRLLAYSRAPELNNKTPQELQKLLLPHFPESKYSLTRSIKEIVSITREITTYTGYWWSSHLGHKPQRHIAYSTLVTRDGTSYILGATLPHARVEAHIILPDRINKVIARINKEGLYPVANTINKDLDYGYFFIIDLTYPYRFITHRQPWAGLTPLQARTIYAPACDTSDCDLVEIVNDLVRVAKEGGGYHVYLWRSKSEEEPTLKITYLKPFKYKQNKYLVGTGLPADITGDDAKTLEKFVENAIELSKEISFDNAISAIKRTNNQKRYLFVDEANPPYRYALNFNEHFNGHTAIEVQKYLDSFGKSPITLQSLAETIGKASKRGGGFIAYEFLTNIEHPEEGASVKVAFVRPFTHNKTLYSFGTGIPIEQALHK